MSRPGRALPALRWLILLLPLVSLPGHAGTHVATGTKPVVLADAAREINLDEGQFSVLRDADGSLTLAAVRTAAADGHFTPLTGSLGAGYTREVYWLKFDLQRGSDDWNWWLEILPPFLDDVQLHLVRPDGRVISKQSGDRQPRAQRDFDGRTLLFRLDAAPGANTVYLRVATTSSMIVVATLWHDSALMASTNEQYLLYGLYLGLVAAVLVFVAITWLLLRESLYLLYIGYLAALLLYTGAASGLLGEFLLPGHPAVADLLVGVGVGLAVASAMAFFCRMLDLGDGPRYLRTVFTVTGALGLITAVAACSGHYRYVITLTQSAILVVIFSAIPLLVGRLRQGTATQRLAALAFLAYGSLALVSALTFTGFIPATRYTMFSSQAGNLAHLFLLHAAIMLRARSSEQERQRLIREAELAQLDAARERGQRDEQDQLLAMITHEIRTPIAVIDAATQSLRLLDAQPPPERQTRYDRISRAARRLGLLLELALNQVRPGSTIEHRRHCDLIELSYDVVGQLEPQGSQQINVWMALESAPTSGNPDLLRFVLINLLDNACKYSPPLSLVDVEVFAETRDDRAGFCWVVADRGPGVAPAERAAIFEKYYRASEESATAGLGLGLYIARQIVSQCGGTLACIEPVGGVGARFECWLPAAAQG